MGPSKWRRRHPIITRTEFLFLSRCPCSLLRLFFVRFYFQMNEQTIQSFGRWFVYANQASCATPAEINKTERRRRRKKTVRFRKYFFFFILTIALATLVSEIWLVDTKMVSSKLFAVMRDRCFRFRLINGLTTVRWTDATRFLRYNTFQWSIVEFSVRVTTTSTI